MSRHPACKFDHLAQSWRRRVRAAGWGSRVARYLGPCQSGLVWVAPFELDPRLAAWFLASGFSVDLSLSVVWLDA